MKQPDTTTIEGKIEVMEAFKKGKLIEYLSRAAGWEKVLTPSWNWDRYDYRIHPDDLNAFKIGDRVRVNCPGHSLHKYIPWTYETCPLGAVVVHKKNKTMRLITGKSDIMVVTGGMGSYTYREAFDTLIMEDGSPCGTKID